MDRDTFFFLAVDVDDLSLDNLAQPPARPPALRMRVISDLRNVDQAVNARYDLSECAGTA